MAKIEPISVEVKLQMEEDFKQYIKAKVEHAVEMCHFQVAHETTWGVPYGPTLSMVEQPKELTGLERYLRGRNA